MELQTLQSVPEGKSGINTEEAEAKTEGVRTEDDDEEFYERIEAPKFVDFTKPYTCRTDDRYWFCSRVGCDRKHEEEINPEEISKNFVLRVLAATSPNIKLRKANREHSSLKSPLSAPAKPSKPWMPRLAMGDPQSKTGSSSKVGSTPVAKTRQVAAKYMTTPRNKVCHPNPDSSFPSVENPKATTVDVPKIRTVSKALVFRSPNKAIVLKKSVELHTPLTKICEGMKRLGISSQKKTFKGSLSKPKKPETQESSRRRVKIFGSEKKIKDLAPLKTPNKKTPAYSLHEQVAQVKLSDGSTSEICKKEDLHPTHETSDTSNSHALRVEMNHLPNMASAEDHRNQVEVGFGSEHIDDGSTSEFNKREDLHPHETSNTSNSHALRAEMNNLSNIVSAEGNQNQVEVGFGSEQIDDGKENALNHQDNNRSHNQPLGDKILSKEMHKKNKVVQTAGPGITKCKKPKPTSIKPFRLRTDERGILKEAILEKKLHIPAPKKEVAKDTSVTKMTYRVPKNEKFSTSDNDGKESGLNTARRRPESTLTSLRTRSQRVMSPKKVKQLGVIEEKSSKLPSDVTVEANKSRAVSAARSTSRGKRPVTIAKEPNFHTSQMPRTCSKKAA